MQDLKKKKQANQDYCWICNINEDTHVTSSRQAHRGAKDLPNARGQWRSFIRTHRRQMASRTDDDDDECGALVLGFILNVNALACFPYISQYGTPHFTISIYSG